MATKTITVTENAYNKLKRLKKKGESFSEVIERFTASKSLGKLADLAEGREAEKIDVNVDKVRSEMDSEFEERVEEIAER